MLNLEYHKGQLCAYKPLLCQEGFCSECIIYVERSLPTVPTFVEGNRQPEFIGKVYKKQHRKAQEAKPLY